MMTTSRNRSKCKQGCVDFIYFALSIARIYFALSWLRHDGYPAVFATTSFCRHLLSYWLASCMNGRCFELDSILGKLRRCVPMCGGRRERLAGRGASRL